MDQQADSRPSCPTITPDDLAWWLDLAPTVEWTWATTYADSAPHGYIVLGRTPGLNREDFVRAGAAIRTMGQPGKFYQSTNIYLEDGRWKYWTMDARVRDTDLINRASRDRVYGAQDAPRTFSGTFTTFDRIAADYDRRRDHSRDEEITVQVRAHFGDSHPRTLDVGCGTGVLLDLGLTTPALYSGIDPSQGMLNELILKHPRVQRLIPARLEDIPDSQLSGPYELVLAWDVPDLDSTRLQRLARDLLLIGP